MQLSALREKCLHVTGSVSEKSVFHAWMQEVCLRKMGERAGEWGVEEAVAEVAMWKVEGTGGRGACGSDGGRWGWEEEVGTGGRGRVPAAVMLAGARR